jgi:hypothetical protein
MAESATPPTTEQDTEQIAPRRLNSILIADCGTAKTKAVLLERVSGTYRFVARGEAITSAEAPWHDITVGVQHAAAQIEEVTGRTLMDEGYLVVPEEGVGIGVDAFLALVSAAQPLQIILAGLVKDLSLASAGRAAAGTYSIPLATISRDPTEEWLTAEDQVGLIANSRPEVVCVVGGTDDGAALAVLELVEAAAIGCSMISEEERPRLLYAGNKALRKRVVSLVSGHTEVRSTENVRPETDTEDLEGIRTELDVLYRQRKLEQLPGGEVLTRWSTLPLTPTAKAFSHLIHYLWHLDESEKGTLGIDVGAAHTTVAATFEGQLYLTILGNMGSAYGGKQFASQDVLSITRWLPYPTEEDEVLGELMNREVRPWTVAQEPEDMWLDYAAAIESIRRAMRVAQPGWETGKARRYPHLTPEMDPILLSGGILTNAPRPGHAALIALDAIEPIGVSTLLLDVNGLAPALGGAARLSPLATVEALDNGAVVNLATVVAPVGIARRGEVILRVRISYEGMGELDLEVPYGSLEVLPLPIGQEAVINLRPRRRFDVGMGGPGRGGRQRISGSLVGLIIDARGRPLRLARDPNRRQTQNQQWIWDMGG